VALSINEFEGEEFWGDLGQPGCLSTGEEVIRNLSFENYSVWEGIVIVLALMACFNLIAYMLLRFKKNKYLKLEAPNPDSAAKAEEGDKLMKYLRAKQSQSPGSISENATLSSPSNGQRTSTIPLIKSDNDNNSASTTAEEEGKLGHNRDGSSDLVV